MKNFSIEQNHIENLSKKRIKLNDECIASWDDEYGSGCDGAPALKLPDEVDILADEILDSIKKWRYVLPFEFIFDELTKLGWAPCLLYDDDGHFAVADDGWSEIPEESPGDIHLGHYITKNQWKDSIREALNYFLDTE